MPKFQKGQSGNPAGRKPGSGSLLTKELKSVLKARSGEKAKAFAQKLIEQSLAGNTQAAKLVLERVDGRPRTAEELAKVEAANQPSMSREQQRKHVIEMLRSAEFADLLQEAIAGDAKEPIQ